MADILEEIVAHKRIEIEQRKRFIQPRQMITLTEQKMQEDGGKVPGGSMKAVSYTHLTLPTNSRV